MADLEKMMKQAQEMQDRMTKLQEDLEHVELVGESGGGKIKLSVNGKGEAKSISIDASLTSEIDVLCDLVVAAMNDARNKTEVAVAERTKNIMSELTGQG